MFRIIVTKHGVYDDSDGEDYDFTAVYMK